MLSTLTQEKKKTLVPWQLQYFISVNNYFIFEESMSKQRLFHIIIKYSLLSFTKICS